MRLINNPEIFLLVSKLKDIAFGQLTNIGTNMDDVIFARIGLAKRITVPSFPSNYNTIINGMNKKKTDDVVIIVETVSGKYYTSINDTVFLTVEKSTSVLDENIKCYWIMDTDFSFYPDKLDRKFVEISIVGHELSREEIING